MEHEQTSSWANKNPIALSGFDGLFRFHKKGETYLSDSELLAILIKNFSHLREGHDRRYLIIVYGMTELSLETLRRSNKNASST